jgi:predicted kinase
MTELRITRGLPASGKTTYARTWAAEDPAGRVRVNRDDLRANLYGQPVLSFPQEELVTTVQHAAVRAALTAGRSVIVDDTHLRIKHARAWANVAAELGCSFHVVDMATTLEQCLQWNTERAARGERAVPADVIEGMHRRFVAQHHGNLPAVTPTTPKAARPVTEYQPNPALPPAWVFDVDGTLALMGDRRSPYDYDSVHLDEPHSPVVDAAAALQEAGNAIIVMSGRPDTCREATTDWLQRHGIPYNELHMRQAGDQRDDAIVKDELFHERVAPSWHVRGVVDDRDRVVAMWRAKGLVCMQVAPGAF